MHKTLRVRILVRRYALQYSYIYVVDMQVGAPSGEPLLLPITNNTYIILWYVTERLSTPLDMAGFALSRGDCPAGHWRGVPTRRLRARAGKSKKTGGVLVLPRSYYSRSIR